MCAPPDSWLGKGELFGPLQNPNVFNAAPGTKLDFLSFDHTTGRLVIDGTATVSAQEMTDAVTSDHDTSPEAWSQEGPAQGRRNSEF